MQLLTGAPYKRYLNWVKYYYGEKYQGFPF